ncbi:MAG TPA: hypothetical protein PK466_07780 [Thermotogota bacterium]|nr:hypothetical protein [Thermotogota bacterium]HPJ88514.1 hypothetical protein [Thermotogota bacterium]HPR96214.1 hypothetical protein [Thermotogota bacterium]
MRNGYWMKNINGDEILLINIGWKSHISFLNKNPELFNLSCKDVEERYLFYSEPVGYEGRARNDLMIMALQNGWIRIRNHGAPQDNWIIQCADNDKCMIFISKFLDHVLNKTKVLSNYQRITVTDLNDHIVEYREFIDGKEFFFSDERSTRMKDILLIVKSFSDF